MIDIAGNTEASEQQAFDDLSQAGGYENNSGQESWEDSDSGDVEHLGEKNENNKAELGNSCEENYNTSFGFSIDNGSYCSLCLYSIVRILPISIIVCTATACKQSSNNDCCH